MSVLNAKTITVHNDFLPNSGLHCNVALNLAVLKTPLKRNSLPAESHTSHGRSSLELVC